MMFMSLLARRCQKGRLLSSSRNGSTVASSWRRRVIMIMPSNSCSTSSGKYLSSLSSSSSSLPTKPTTSCNTIVTIGIMRETYDPWERRSPLTPQHVRELLQRHNTTTTTTPKLRILVQPCQRRVFSADEYQQAGAVVTSDLNAADLILGVKRPANESLLLPNKTYMFFSHTIKGQPENMALLRACLQEHVQLLDYERLLDADTAQSVDKMKRLVSFGRFAGLAGAIDTLHGWGRRLLTEGVSTPLLSCPPAILCDDLAQAQDRIQQIGRKIATNGLPNSGSGSEPMVVAITGQGGSVHGGVMDILDLLPHEVVPVGDLPYLYQTESTKRHHHLYLVPLATKDAFARKDGAGFDRDHYQKHPDKYCSMLPTKVVPYTSVLVNCAYWDSRFPRLLTKNDMRVLHNEGNKRLKMVSDISCDVNGSIEFLLRSTTIDKPFFQYDPLMESEVADTINDMGITVLGVDILPTELPVESSQHFGNKLMSVLEELIDVKAKNSQTQGIPTYALSNGVAFSAITNANGRLTMRYRYLQQLLNSSTETNEKDLDRAILAIRLEGHLFDSGVINQVLDVIERRGYAVHLDEFVLPKHHPHTPIKSSILLTILDKEAQDEDKIGELETELDDLIKDCVEADATMTRVDPATRSKATAKTTDGPPPPKALVLGSGFVARTALESLARANIQVTLVSNSHEEAIQLAAAYDNIDYVVFDVQSEQSKLSRLIRNSSVVVSLLPAPMHPFVAKLSLAEKTHLVTSSYESDELRSMQDQMKDAGMICLNEVGLDPGLDHMSSMKIIDDIHGRGGNVVSFSSVCGGLPSPEAANNPFGYKFSWSPRGVLRASSAPARFLLDDKVVEIQGNDLLNNARPFTEGWPEMGLEVLPNRDSLKYADIYGIPQTQTIFRGTLRYGGFSTLLATLRNMGLMDEEVQVDETWYSTILSLAKRRGFQQVEDFALACTEENVEEASRALKALQWLEVLRDASVEVKGSVIDAFCHVLQDKLCYQKGEQDMVLMHHNISAIFEDGSTEAHVSSLQVRGSEQHSAMSQTVGYTVGAATQFVLSHATTERGLLLPITPKIYQPILDAIAKHGIRFEDDVVRDSPRNPLGMEQRA